MSTLAVIASVLICVALSPFALAFLFLIAGHILCFALSIAELFRKLSEKVIQRKQTKEKRKSTSYFDAQLIDFRTSK